MAPGIPSAIYNCPLDVLKYIFEYAVEGASKDECSNMATSFSHVCQRWRSAAIDTPNLWLNLECDMNRSEESIRDYWERIYFRPRSLPTTVVLDNVGMSSKSFLRHCKLDSIPDIDTLVIRIATSKGVKDILHRSFQPPNGVLRTLQLSNISGRVSGGWDCSLLLNTFPPVTNLNIAGVSGVIFTGKKPFPSINSLSLEKVREVYLGPLIYMFPSLTSMELLHMSSDLFVNEANLTLQRLRYLKLHGMQPLFWTSQVCCPSLMHLIIDEPQWLHTPTYTAAWDAYERRVIDFVHRHKTITSLEVPTIRDITQLAEKAPQILHLRVHPAFAIWSPALHNPNTSPIFPYLRTISLEAPGYGFFGSQFPDFVRFRCLPITHHDSRLSTPDPLESITLFDFPLDLGKEGGWGSAPWRSSELFSVARKTVLPRRDGNEDCGVRLSWV